MNDTELLEHPIEIQSADWKGGFALANVSMGSAVETIFNLEVKGDRVVGQSHELRFMVEFLAQEDGGFVAHVPAMPSASTQGRDLPEALSAVRENLIGILEEEAHAPIIAESEREYLSGPDDFQHVVSLTPDEAAAPKPSEVEAAIGRDGWSFARQKGSHRHYKHATKKGLVTIPFHCKDIYPQLLHSIIRQAGLTPEQFIELL